MTKKLTNQQIIVMVTFLTCALLLLIVLVGKSQLLHEKQKKESIKVGFLYDGDESTPYTYNFIRSQSDVELQFGARVTTVVRSNVTVEDCETMLNELIDEGCDLIFCNSYGFGETTKKLAVQHPDIQFCQATCDNANTEPVVSNYHTFMGEIYEGRYLAGVVAGMKLKEMIDNDEITEREAVVGYVAAFPYAEVISGYTAFFMGVRREVPTATMRVKYTNSWSNYNLEKEYASQMIEEGCVLISQHSDTNGPAVACEESGKNVFHVGYNKSMLDVAPTTSLVSCRINWTPYMTAAVSAVLDGEKIENETGGHVHGNDVGAGLKDNWVQILDRNTLIVTEKTEEKLQSLITEMENHTINVYYGNYTGTDPYDPTDTIDLTQPYQENENASAPSFHYVLDDVIIVED
ncbi:MAG: BMP family ABC transporter substrate-binding protein [Lachnospiraceae bacterium]|nr:BMP family ABC transporter substrate-binding protein [Lachnospiraceae bacterium]